MYDKDPYKYLYYDMQPPKKLFVELYPWDCEDAICQMDKCMLQRNNDDKLPEYVWDGEKFVKQQFSTHEYDEKGNEIKNTFQHFQL